MTQINSHQNKSTTKKGNAGERVMMRIIRSIFHGANIFTPAEEDGAHQCDAVVIDWNKKRIVLVDSKAKPAMSFYPDTGIDTRHYKTYLALGKRHRALVLLCFIDEACGLAYGNFLWFLNQERVIWWEGKNINYPRSSFGSTGNTLQFPLDYMRQLAKLLPDEVEELQKNSTRNRLYMPNDAVYARLGIALAENSWMSRQLDLMDGFKVT